MSFRVLCCVDGSSYAQGAARLAVDVAVATRGALTVLHVVNVTADPTGNPLLDLAAQLGFEPARVPQEIAVEHVDRGRAWVDRVASVAAGRGVAVEATVRTAPVRIGIAEAAKHADLVVVGLRGVTEEEFPGQGGGHLESTLDDVSAPVLLCPRGIERIQRFVVGYDGSAASAHGVAAIRALRAAGLDVPVLAVHVGLDGAVLDELSGPLEGSTVTRRVLPADGSVHETLAAVAREVSDSVLVLGFRGRSRSRDFFVGTAVDQLLRAGDVAVLVAH